MSEATKFKLFDDITPIQIDITETLTSLSKLSTEVIDIYFGIKTKTVDNDFIADGDPEPNYGRALTSSTDPLTFDTGTNIVTVPFASTDYGTDRLIVNDSPYHVAFGLKFTGDIKFREIELKDFKTIRITQDKIRN